MGANEIAGAAVALGVAGTAGYLIAAKLKGWWPFAPTPTPGQYACPTCGATFSTLEALNAHIASAHPGQPRQYVVSTSVSPSGGGSVTGEASYAAGATVTLTAVPSSGYTFSRWSGDATGTANPVSFTMPARNISVVANFTAISPPTYHALTVEAVGRAKAGLYEVPRYPIDGATVTLSGPQPGQRVTGPPYGSGSVNWASLPDGTYSVTVTHPSFTTLTGEVALHSDLIVTFQLQGGPIEPTLRSSYVPADGYFSISLLFPMPIIKLPQAPVQGFPIYGDADDPGWGPHHVDAYVFETDELAVMVKGDPRIKYEYVRPALFKTATEKITGEYYDVVYPGYQVFGDGWISVVKRKFATGVWPWFEYWIDTSYYYIKEIDLNERTGVVRFHTPIKGLGKFLQVSIRGEEYIQGYLWTKWSHLIHEILREAAV